MKKFALVVLSATLLQSCAWIVDGRHQDIALNTTPPAAQCDLNRAGARIGQVGATPGMVNIKKTKDDITVHCAKEGYADATYVAEAGVDYWILGNILIGGLIGLGLDFGTGAWNEYDEVVNLTLAGKPEAGMPSTALVPARMPQPEMPETGSGPLPAPSRAMEMPAEMPADAPTRPRAMQPAPANSTSATPFGTPSAPLGAPAAKTAPRAEAKPNLSTRVVTAPAAGNGGWGALGTDAGTGGWGR